MSTTRTPHLSLSLVAVCAAACLLIVACQTEPDVVDDTARVTTTTETSSEGSSTIPDGTEVDPIAIVMASLEIWNEGDLAGWLALHSEPPDQTFEASVMNSKETIELEGECQIASETVLGTAVECPIAVSDDFHGAGGLVSSGQLRTLVDSDGLIADMSKSTYHDDSGSCCPAWQAYHREFFEWLESAHPDVHAQIGPSDGNPSWYLPGVASGNPDHMLIALDYVDEFVAESDKYPLAETTAAEDLAPVVEPLGRGSFVSGVSGELTSLIGSAHSIGGEFDDASDIVFAKITIPVGGVAPWHTHTGPALLVNVGPGTLSSVLTEDCLVQEVAPGAAFLDPGDGTPHTAVNNSDGEVVLYVAFLGVVENPVVGADHPEGCDL